MLVCMVHAYVCVCVCGVLTLCITYAIATDAMGTLNRFATRSSASLTCASRPVLTKSVLRPSSAGAESGVLKYPVHQCRSIINNGSLYSSLSREKKKKKKINETVLNLLTYRSRRRPRREWPCPGHGTLE